MHNALTFVCIAITLWNASSVFAGAATEREITEPSTWTERFVERTTARRELSALEYRKYRDQAFARATSRTAATLTNPEVSEYGFSTEVVVVLQEQVAYLRRLNSSSLDNAGGTGRSPGHGNSLTTSGPLLLTQRPEPRPPNTKQPLSASSCHSQMVQSVNGKSRQPIFTPQPPNNIYLIAGCGFGKIPGRVQLESDSQAPSTGTRSLPIALQLDSENSWSENEIRVHLDPRISGIPDSPVALVIYSGTARVELSGCRFVAVRGEPQLLATIPASWVKLHATTASSHPVEQIEYISPPVRGDGVPRDAAGSSVLVVRSDSGDFDAGADSYDFSGLNKGWMVHSIQIQNYSISCPGDVTQTRSFGSWGATWTGHGFTLAWENDKCESFIPPVFNFKVSSSQYAIKVWVIGPAGTCPLVSEAESCKQR